MLKFWKKKSELLQSNNVKCEDNEIVATASGLQIPLEEVQDEVFTQKILGEGISFQFEGKMY